MSGLKNKIRKAKKVKNKSELVATTVRIPKELQIAIEDLAEYLSESKQDVMLDLIQEGINVAEETFIESDDESDSTEFHVLNTNKRHDIEAHKEMLNQGIAAAFYSPWKLEIEKLNQNDTVFLYENGVGIVAYGKATGKTLKKNYEGHDNECYYQELEEFTVLENPVPASEIKKILDRNVVFLRTRASMRDGQKILDKLNNERNI